MRLLKRKIRKPEGCGKLELERVIGLTTASASGLSSNAVTGDIAYLAGCVVAVYNVKSNCQTRFLMAPKSSKNFSCIAYSSQGGKFLAAGESGHQPGVIVWEAAVGSCVAELRTHKHGVCSVQFSPNGKHLVSIGVPHDGHVCLWDWKSGTLLAKARASKASQPACAMQFASDGSFFITGGAKHLKHWVIGLPKARSAGGNGTIGLEGKSVRLGSQMDSSFVSILSAPPSKEATAVTPDFQPLYALSAGGVLCLLHYGLAIEKWVDLKVRHGYALAISEVHVGCACSDGIVRIFMHGSLAYAVTLPRPAPYGYHGLTDANLGASLAVGNHTQPGIRFPDAIACSFLQDGHSIAVIYGDHSLLVWDLQSFSKIGRHSTLLSHNSCIWDVSVLPTPQQAPALQSINEKDCSPSGAFATCSADGTIRLWHLGSGQETSGVGFNATFAPPGRPANIYSNDVLGVLYIDNKGEQREKVINGSSDDDLADSLQGFRTICATPDGQHLAAGDRNGNLRIYDLNTLQLISFKEAHDGEILSLSFTSNTNDRLVEEPVCVPLLASAGRDRLIHIYDVNRGYDVVETLDDHSGSVTTIKFACSGSKLLSCSADKSVIFRHVVASGTGCKSTRYHQELAPRGTFYDIDIEPSDKLAVAVGQDKKLSILNLTTGKIVRYLRPEGDVGEPIKVRLDPSGMYLVCSHSDKTMRVYDFSNGELLAHASGHGDIITGMIFLPDCRRLVSVSGDSCIFIWRLPLNMSRSMRKRCIANADSRSPPKCLKPAPSQSPRHFATTNNIPRRLYQVIPFDPLDVKAKEGCHFDRKGRSGQKKQGEETTSFVAHDADMPHTEPSESKKRFVREGYRSLSEPRRETGPPGAGCSIRNFSAEGLATNSPDNTPGTQTLEPEGCPLLTVQESLRQSPRHKAKVMTLPYDLKRRREPHWKTVHTVFFSENEYSHDEFTAKAGSQDLATCESDRKNRTDSGGACSNTMAEQLNTLEEKITERTLDRETKNSEIMCDSDSEDGVGTDVSDNDEGSSTHGLMVEPTRPSDAGEDIDTFHDDSGRAVTCDGIKSGRDKFEVPSRRGQFLGGLDALDIETLDQTKQVGRVSMQDIEAEGELKRMTTVEGQNVYNDTDLIKDDDEDGDDDDFQNRDSFSGRFHNLASNRKMEGSDRTSFSARFFARSDLSRCQSPWFDTLSSPKADRIFAPTDTHALSQDDELESNPGRLLAAERERLKLRERQDKMAVEVQRMRERLINLGIAVAEIAHDGEITYSRKWDGEENFSEGCQLPHSENPVKPLGFSKHAATDYEDASVLNPTLKFSEYSHYGVKRASSFCVSNRVADGNESMCSDTGKIGTCKVSTSIGLSSLESVAPGKIGTPRTPTTHTLRSLDGRKIDLWQIKAKEEPGGEKGRTMGVKEDASLAAKTPIGNKGERCVDLEGSGFGHVSSSCQPIKVPSKQFGRVLANRGDRNVAERGTKSQGHSPRKRTTFFPAKYPDTAPEERIDHQTEKNLTESISTRVTLSPTSEEEMMDRQEIISSSGKDENYVKEQGQIGRILPNIETKVENQSSLLPPTCTFSPCGDPLRQAKSFETSNLERTETCNQHKETDTQGDKHISLAQRRFERCRSIDMNEFLGELPGVEAQDKSPCSPSGTDNQYVSSPPLPRPIEDYQKSLYDLMEAADRASSYFGEVRTICRKTTPSEAPENPCTPSATLPPELLSLTRTYQRLMPGTLQTVQRLADDAAVCGLPCNKVKSIEDNRVDDLSLHKSHDYDLLRSSSVTGASMFQSRPGTGMSSTDSLLASVDVEGFISRYSETLASQVLALVHRALPSNQT